MRHPERDSALLQLSEDLVQLGEGDVTVKRLVDHQCRSPVTASQAFHGNQAEPDKPVKVTCGKQNGDVSITVSDQGTGFDPESVADPISDENLLKDVGRGIFIVKSLMDKIDFQPPKLVQPSPSPKRFASLLLRGGSVG